ncbi:MAG TPA: GAF domain-containing protein [Mycobacteriales bacterium]|nr:GAF domain-containing protein [Mycobacteriales bacterium]
MTEPAGERESMPRRPREVRVDSGHQPPAGARQLLDLFDALIALGAGVGLPAALRRITEVARDVTGARYAVFAATPASRGSVPALVRSGVAEDPPPPGLTEVLRDPGGLLGIGGLLRLGDLHDHPRRADLPAGLPAGTGLLATPIVADGDLYGGLLLFSRPGVGFTAEDEAALMPISAATGVVISTAALRHEAQTRQRWLEASADVVATLLASDSSERVLELVAYRARDVADADVAAILAPAVLSGELAVPAAAGDNGHRLGNLAVSEFADHISEVQRTGEPRLLVGAPPPAPGLTPPAVELSAGSPAAGPVAGLPPRSAVEPGIGSAGLAGSAGLDGPSMLVPFAAGNRPLGVLLVTRLAGRPGFGDTDLAMASMFAGHAALAVEFARAHRDREWLAVLEDRDRIARDLHDVVIQRLFVAGLSLQAVTRTLDSPELVSKLERTVDDLDRTVTEIRRSIFSLRSPLVGRDGLRARLLSLCTTAAGLLGTEPQVRLDGPLDTVVPDPIADHLAAVLREALTNITRHAQASEVEVQARTDGTGLLLEVSDNGIGVDPAVLRRGGLANIARRAEELGGLMKIGPGPAGGTVLTWEVPLASR